MQERLDRLPRGALLFHFYNELHSLHKVTFIMHPAKSGSRPLALTRPHRETVELRIEVPDGLHRSLKAAAANHGVTLAALVAWLLRKGMEQEATS